MGATILHISSVDPIPNTGMGRVSFFWKQAFEKAGYNFLHVGLTQIGQSIHPLLSPLRFRHFIRKNKIKPDLILAHEPLAGFLKIKNIPLISFSHGLEERNWLEKKKLLPQEITKKSRLIPTAIRFYSNNQGFKKADLIFVLNSTDKNYLIQHKKIEEQKIKVIKNGLYPGFLSNEVTNKKRISFLYNGSWVKRKGIDLLIACFNVILRKHKNLELVIAGCNKSEIEIVNEFENDVRNQIKVIPFFSFNDEIILYTNNNIFVLPSYFEGQSLALLQAMGAGLCPIVSDNSGQIDLIKDGINGLVFKTGDIESLINRVDYIIKNPDKIHQFGQEAQKTVQKWNWNDVSNNVVALIDNQLNI